MVGAFIAEGKLRDRLVLAPKAGFASGAGPHMGGNGAKHVRAALARSLLRLRTDYIDLITGKRAADRARHCRRRCPRPDRASPA